MKPNRWFVVSIVVFLVLLFILEMQLPKNFSWTPTFRHTDKQPFGSCLFDSLLSSTMPKGYTVTDSSLYQLAKDSLQPRGILVVADEMNLIPAEVNAIFSMANNGSHVMLVAHGVGDFMCNRLGIRMWGYGNSFDLQNFVKYNKERESFEWVSEENGYKPRRFMVFKPLITRKFNFETDSLDNVIRPCLDQQATLRHDAVSATFRQGKGYITFCSLPLLFTNYGIVDQDNATFSLRLLTLMKDLPVVRTEAYCPQTSDEVQQSPLRYAISQPPLRWALYTLMVGALLFLIFEGRRRQRVIPIEKAPENHSLEFIHLVGSLYYHSRERRSLVVRKWTYFAEELRRNIHLDVADASEDDVTLPTLARLTTIDEQEIRTLVLQLRQLVAAEETEISKKQMKQYIDQMNWIIKNI
ncbi:MAG: DUF4350 domain-containing protein [Prevotella sp.]|nr:DUF4350 domain-containing protein [Prevotella sp.]